MTEKNIIRYLDSTLSAKVSELVKKAQKEAEETVIKSLEQSLKDNLTEDTIKRMNIPKALERLQNMTLEVKEEKK